MNILYLDDNINYYCFKKNKIITWKPYLKTLKFGTIINRYKFIKSFNNMLDKNNIKPGILKEDITIIVTNIYENIDKEILTDILKNYNYNKIKIVNELDYLKLTNKEIYINYNDSYYYLLYRDDLGKVVVDYYRNIEVNRIILLNIIKYLNKEIIIYGTNKREIESILNKEKIKYYIYNENNLIMKLILAK